MLDAGAITCKPMFGGHTLYCEGKGVALVCDNRLFVKPTQAGKSFIGDVAEAPPYAGTKSFFLIQEQLDDKKWMSHLIKLTEEDYRKLQDFEEFDRKTSSWIRTPTEIRKLGGAESYNAARGFRGILKV